MESTQIDRCQLLAGVRRIVVKVGSTTISRNFDLNTGCLDGLVEDLVTVRRKGREVILVTSGAIAAGTGRLELPRRPQTLPGLQAAAAVGQSRLMHAYESRFQRYNLITGMMLLTQDDFNSRERYTHMSDTLRALLGMRVVPIINENDTIAVEEIKVGDNDTLAAYVTNLAEADLLVILSDQDGFYTADPRKQPQAKLISIVPNITEELHRAAGSAGSADGIGGMITKLRAAEIVTGSGEMMVLANGSVPQVVNRILSGENLGTLFLPQERMSGRKRWIAYSRPPKGLLFVDNGARDAVMLRGTSLLPSGVQRVKGDFAYGDTVSCLDENEREFARGLVNYDIRELIQIMGKQTGEIRTILGYHYYDEIIHRDNLVVVRKCNA
ncbi:MAG: glutamate 5-kinase [Candidatus Poribacteria bacterium]|nr:glutamate 5-kinase [Candidatus Poribacteria bacterium]